MAHFPFIIWNWQVMSKKKRVEDWPNFFGLLRTSDMQFLAKLCHKNVNKIVLFSKVFGIIWSYGNTGYKVSNSGIQNSSLPPFTRWNRFSVIVFTLLIDFKPLTVHSSSATPNFSTCNAAADTKVNAQISLHNTHQLELFW